jgi:septum formation protein
VSIDFVLGSASPRRRQLCEEAGYRFLVDASQVEEPRPAGFDRPEAYAVLTAWTKAQDVAARHPEEIVIGADTIVVSADGEIMGKPTDQADAERIMRSLMGTRHQVITAVCLALPHGAGNLFDTVTSWVVMKSLPEDQLAEHLRSGRWEGKAGAYGIQDKEDPLVTLDKGSGSNVVGLPMERLVELLALARRAMG